MFILSWFLPMTLVSNRGTAAPLDVFNSIKYRSSHVTRILAVSEAVKQVLCKSGRIFPEKIEVIHSAVDLDDFDPALDGRPVRGELGLPAGAPVVGVIGSLRFVPGHLKGGMELLAAARTVIAACPQTRFLIVGAVDRELFRRAADPSVVDRFIFTGFREDVPRMMAACDLIASSSTRLEGLASVLREALAMKKPVVATDVGGNRELVVPDQTGLLVPPGDPEALARAIITLQQNPELAASLAAAGRKLVEEEFSLTARVERVEGLYYRAVAGDLRRRPQDDLEATTVPAAADTSAPPRFLHLSIDHSKIKPDRAGERLD